MKSFSPFFLNKIVNFLVSYIPNYNNNNLFIYSKSIKKFDPVTELDLEIEQKIKKIILKDYPNSNFIGEETKKIENNNKLTWVVDPIDGTKNFLLGSPIWSNLVGLSINNVQRYGLALFPSLKKFYFSDSKKTYLFSNFKNKKILKSSKKYNIKDAKIVSNTFNTIKNKKLFNFFLNHKGFFKISNLDALNYCLLAEGKIDIIIESKVKNVDILPLIPIIKNSGGKISNWDGTDDLSRGNILVASNGNLHLKMLSIMKKIKI